MGDMGTVNRKNPRRTGKTPASSPQSSRKTKQKCAVAGNAAKTGRNSSSSNRARTNSRDSESQSSSDAGDTEHLTHHYEFKHQEPGENRESVAQASPNFDHDVFTRNCEPCLEREPGVQDPKKAIEKSASLGPSYQQLMTSVPNELKLVAILVVFGLFLVSYFVLSKYSASLTVPRSLGDVEGDIVRDLDTLRSETTQEMNFWRSLYSGLTTVTEQAPRLPVVLLLAVPLDASLTAVCLAQNLTDIVSRAFADPSVVKHDTLSHLHKPWDDHKLALDSHLQGLSRSHAAIILNLEKMPPKTATLLHGYFDNDNAPYKRAVVVVLLELELHYSSVSEAHLDLTVERRLHELWRQDLGQDDIPGLISRVAVQPLLVKPESKFVLQKLCPM